MGGHAVRYYGVDRNTSDFDLVAAVASPTELSANLRAIPLLAGIREVSVWRRDDFARFEIGALPDGRPELLEFWLHNHLLPEFESLKARAEVGRYGGKDIPFISLTDLLKSKETERESDWQDISLLEEIRDERGIARAKANGEIILALSGLRSRRGLENCETKGLLADIVAIETALETCSHPVTFAMLYPLSTQSSPNRFEATIGPTIFSALASSKFRSPSHLGIVEVVRRAYKRAAMEQDRLDKQAKVKLLQNRETPR